MHVVMMVVKRTMSSIEVLAMQHICYGASQSFVSVWGGGGGMDMCMYLGV